MNSDEKQCPYCAELVTLNAIKCKHCGSDINEYAQESQNQELISSFASFNLYRIVKVVLFVAITSIILISSNPKKSSFVNHIDMKVMNYANQNGGALGLGVASLISTPIVNKSITRYDFHIFSIFKIEPFIAKMIDENIKSDSPIYFVGFFHLMYYKIPAGVAESLIGFDGKKTNISKSNRENSKSGDIGTLLMEEENLNSICRGTSGSKSAIACDQRDKIVYELNQRGWCYGEHGQASYQYEWHPCKSSSVRKR